MPHSIPTHYVQQYTTNVEMLLQQQGGKLRDKVTLGRYTGKNAKFIEQFGRITPSRNLPRNADTPLAQPSADARWVAPNGYDVGILIDDQDKLRMLIDPQSGYTMNMVNGMRLAEDDEILNAIFAPALTGENGTTTTTFPATANNIGINVGGTNSGINVQKLRAARTLAMQRGISIETEPLMCIIDAQGHDELLGQIEIANRDYNTQAVLVDGWVKRFMGYEFVCIEFTDANSYPLTAQNQYMKSSGGWYYPVFPRSAMHFGMWEGMTIDIGPRRDKRNATQIYMKMTCGASRTQENKVIRIDSFRA